MKKANIILLVSILFMACTQQNPLLNQPQTPFGAPAFDQVQLKHYLPAFKEAIRLNQEEIDAIVNNEEAPTFENTIVALDRSGIVLDRVCGVFYNVLEADGNEQMDAIANDGCIRGSAAAGRWPARQKPKLCRWPSWPHPASFHADRSLQKLRSKWSKLAS